MRTPPGSVRRRRRATITQTPEFTYYYGEQAFGTPAEFTNRAPQPVPDARLATETMQEKGYVLVKALPDLRAGQAIPGGLAFDQQTVEGVYVSQNPDSPFHGVQVIRWTLNLFKPGQAGQAMDAGNILCQYSTMQAADDDGDRLWLWGEYTPPGKPTLLIKAATGKFEGLKGRGTWHWRWPEGWEEPRVPEGYDYASAQEMVLEYPVQ